MPEAVLRRLVNEVSCRDYNDVLDPFTEGFGVERTSVSRSFVEASEELLDKFARRRFEADKYLAVCVDGIEYGGEMMVVAMGETLTVIRLGVPEELRKTLATTNPIESALSVTRARTGRVRRRRPGDMRLRWCSAGLLEAERRFRRVRGYKQLNQLETALQTAFTRKSLAPDTWVA